MNVAVDSISCVSETSWVHSHKDLHCNSEHKKPYLSLCKVEREPSVFSTLQISKMHSQDFASLSLKQSCCERNMRRHMRMFFFYGKIHDLKNFVALNVVLPCCPPTTLCVMCCCLQVPFKSSGNNTPNICLTWALHIEKSGNPVSEILFGKRYLHVATMCK